MSKLFTAITFAFLLGVTLAGCASEKAWLEVTKSDTRPAPLWDKIADRGSE